METNTNLAGQALWKAIKALRTQDRVSARRWAQEAAMLAPHLEEPWLILAAVSAPHAAQVYLEEALRINPSSQKARDGLLWVKNRQAAALKPVPGVEDTQPLKITSVKPAQHRPIISDRLKQGGILAAAGVLSVLLFLALFLSAGLILFYNIPRVKAAAPDTKNQPQWVASIPLEAIYPTSTPGAIRQYVIPATSTPTISSTITATRTARPSPTRVPTLPPFATSRPAGPKRIVVVISEQRVYAYQGNQEIYRFVASTGMSNNTPTGNFTILDKIPNAYSDAFGFSMPSWMGFAWLGSLEDGFHSLPVLSNGTQIWGDKLGSPASYGCVVLGPNDAKLLYNWADVGTPIQIRQ